VSGGTGRLASALQPCAEAPATSRRAARRLHRARSSGAWAVNQGWSQRSSRLWRCLAFRGARPRSRCRKPRTHRPPLRLLARRILLAPWMPRQRSSTMCMSCPWDQAGVRSGWSVLVADGRIVQMGPREDVKPGPERGSVRVIECGGQQVAHPRAGGHACSPPAVRAGERAAGGRGVQGVLTAHRQRRHNRARHGSATRRRLACATTS
jgi:hypothetical protein